MDRIYKTIHRVLSAEVAGVSEHAKSVGKVINTQHK